MSAVIRVDFEAVVDSLGKALEKELAKINGVVSAANAEWAKSFDPVKQASASTTRAIIDDVNKASNAKRRARKQHEEEEAKSVRSLSQLQETALGQIAALQERYATKAVETEEQSARRIVTRILEIRKEYQANKLALANESLAAEEKAEINARQKSLSAEQAVMTTVALKNQAIAERGAGVAAGILGTGRNIEGTYSKVSQTMVKVVGGLGLAAGAFGILSASQNESINQAAAMGATFLPMIGMVHKYAAAEKAAAAAKGISTAAQIKLNLSFLANPIVLIVAAIAGLIAIFASLYGKVEWVTKTVDKLWSTIKGGFQILTDWIGLTSEQARQAEAAARAEEERKKRIAGVAAAYKAEFQGAVDAVEEAQSIIENARKNIEQGFASKVTTENGKLLKTAIQPLTPADLAREKEFLDGWIKERDARVTKLRKLEAIQKKTADEIAVDKEKKPEQIQKERFEREIKEVENGYKEIAALIESNDKLTADQRKRSLLENERSMFNALATVAQQGQDRYNLIRQDARDKELEFDKSAKEKAREIREQDIEDRLEKEKKAAEKIRKAQEVAYQNRIDRIQSNTDSELHLAEVTHITFETAEERHQQRIFEIKQRGLLQQLAATRMFSEEWFAIMKQMQGLHREHEVDMAKTAVDKNKEAVEQKKADLQEFMQWFQQAAQMAKGFLDIGSNASQARRDERTRYEEQIADFEGSLIEKNKLEREHQARLDEIEQEAVDKRKEMIFTQLIPSVLQALVTIYAASVPAAVSNSIATFGTAAVTGLTAVMGVLSSVGGKKYRKGGFTGYGDESEEAGVVHKEEVVIKAPSAKKFGIHKLLYINEKGELPPGFKSGGFVGELASSNFRANPMEFPTEGLANKKLLDLLRAGFRANPMEFPTEGKGILSRGWRDILSSGFRANPMEFPTEGAVRSTGLLDLLASGFVDKEVFIPFPTGTERRRSLLELAGGYLPSFPSSSQSGFIARSDYIPSFPSSSISIAGGMTSSQADTLISEIRMLRQTDRTVVMNTDRMLLSDKVGSRSLNREKV